MTAARSDGSYLVLNTSYGERYSGRCLVTRLSVTQEGSPMHEFGRPQPYFIEGPRRYELEATFYESPTWEYVSKVIQPSTAILKAGLWRCEYCHQVSEPQHLECRKCGAPRTFEYET